MIRPVFDGAQTLSEPFPYVRIPAVLAPGDADRVLTWLRTEAPWTLRVESFYEQHEFSLLGMDLRPNMGDLVSAEFVDEIRNHLRLKFRVSENLNLVDICAHRLTAGQTIRIHNDYIEDQETHRLLIQLNDGWTAARGGLLMLFAEDAPETLREIVMPTHASGFAFEISPRSYHAVSSIKSGERFTLVYTFRKLAPP